MPIQWELLFFSLFVGLGMGAFGLVALAELTGQMEKLRMPGSLTALAALVVGSLFSFFHLGHPERIFHVLGNVGSGIAQELIVTSIAGALIVAYILLLKWERATTGMKKTVAGLGLLFAVIVPFSTGKIYVLSARPAWDTWMIPLLFVAGAAALGMLTMSLWAILKEKEAKVLAQINKITFAMQIFFAAMVAAYILYIPMAPHPHESRNIGRVMTGDLALLFWLAVVVIGVLIPLFLTFRTMTVQKSSLVTGGQRETAAAAVSSASLSMPMVSLICTLIGAVSIRIIMYLMGSSVHQFFVG